MTQQFLSPRSFTASYRILLRNGFSYVLPLILLSGGAVIAQSIPNSAKKPLPSLNQEQPASPLTPVQASESKPQTPALPDYEGVSPLHVNESEATPAESKPQPKTQLQTNPEVQPVQPLVNSPAASESGTSSSSQTAPNVTESSQPSEPKPENSQPNPKVQPVQPLVNSPAASESGTSSSSQTAPNVTESSQPSEPKPESSPTPPVESDPGVPVWQKTGRNASGNTQDFVDFNGYPSTPENPLPAPRVEVSDRAENCTTVIENGKLVSANCQASPAQGDSQQAIVDLEKLPALPKTFQEPTPPESQGMKNTYTPPEDLPELKLPGNGDSALMFPLARSMPISSNYGWRIHPIHGNRRFHSGTDFTAPEGTPVVATKSGRVVLADYTSGYGLIIGLRHNERHESRYAHLSQIHVKPGQWVEQGTVIGRVGNTGLSTGPHLHFEWRIRKGSRWIAVNAGKQLLMAQANLDPSQINFPSLADSSEGLNTSNFFSSLPEMLTSLPAASASWMSVPELSFLKTGNFHQAYQRQAPLTSFSQRSSSVLVLPVSLPSVLGSLFNWEPPQLFAQESWQQVPTQTPAPLQNSIAYRPPATFSEETPISAIASGQESLESLVDLESLGTLNFPAPQNGSAQALSSLRNRKEGYQGGN